MNLKEIYINGIGAISIQPPLSDDGINNPLAYDIPHVRCIEPNFKDYLDPIAARRMSRIIKRSIVTAKHATTEAGIGKPEAIISGTGLGCIEDTEKFLDAMIHNQEKFLQPTFFIQSTHNTISSQIAINLGCNGYNNTYIHRGVSFENALMDASLLFHKGEINSALITGNDEMTPNYFILLNRLNYWKKEVENTLDIIGSNATSGSFAGEGSISFVLSNQKAEQTYAQIKDVDLFYKPTDTVQNKIENFLADNNLSVQDIDVFMTGMNGDANNDNIYSDASKIFDTNNIGVYKHVCGEFYTSVAFGLFASAFCLRNGNVPAHFMLHKKVQKSVRYILIYNHFQNKDHSLILLSAC
jgi:3-oxoacyl-[acyl-carrier-protein] synthase II